MRLECNGCRVGTCIAVGLGLRRTRLVLGVQSRGTLIYLDNFSIMIALCYSTLGGEREIIPNAHDRDQKVLKSSLKCCRLLIGLGGRSMPLHVRQGIDNAFKISPSTRCKSHPPYHQKLDGHLPSYPAVMKLSHSACTEYALREVFRRCGPSGMSLVKLMLRRFPSTS